MYGGRPPPSGEARDQQMSPPSPWNWATPFTLPGRPEPSDNHYLPLCTPASLIWRFAEGLIVGDMILYGHGIIQVSPKVAHDLSNPLLLSILFCYSLRQQPAPPGLPIILTP